MSQVQERRAGSKDPSKMDFALTLKNFSDLISIASADNNFDALNQVEIGIEVTRQMATCIWECGGATTGQFGTCMIVAQADGHRPKSIFSRAGSAKSAGETHALIPISEGNAILIGHQRSGHVRVLVYRIASITTTPVSVEIPGDDDSYAYDTHKGVAVLSLQMIVDKRTNSIYPMEAADFQIENMIEAINVAAKKATIVGCRRAMYIQDWRNVRENDRKYTMDAVDDESCTVYYGKSAARAFMTIVDSTLSAMMTVDEREKPTVIYEQTIVSNADAVAYYNANKHKSQQPKQSIVGGFNVINMLGIGVIAQEDVEPIDTNPDMIRVKCIVITPGGELDESTIGFFDKEHYESIASRWFQNNRFERVLELIKRAPNNVFSAYVQYLGN